MNKNINISEKMLNFNDNWGIMRIGTYDNDYKEYSKENSLVYKPINSNIGKIVPNDFYIHRIPLTGKKPFDKVMDEMAVYMLKKSGLVLYVNSVMNRFEIYSTLPLLDEWKVINNDTDKVDQSYINIENIHNLKSYYMNCRDKVTDIVSNIVYHYINKIPISDKLGFLQEDFLKGYRFFPHATESFPFRIKEMLNELIFQFGYLDTIENELISNPREDGDGDCNRSMHREFSYDRESSCMNSDCFFVISKDPIESLNDLFPNNLFEDYIYKNQFDEDSDCIFRSKISGFYKSDYLGCIPCQDNSKLYEQKRLIFRKLGVQALLGIALSSVDDYDRRH